MRRSIILIFLLLFTLCSIVRAEDLYIAQNQAGSGDGSSCSEAKAVTFFNSSANWGTGAGKISPGDTAHLCGTISTGLTIQAAGSVGSPITIKFEDNAKISFQPTTNNASLLYVGSRSYIIIDGGTNGIIEATDNGTSSTYGGAYTYQWTIFGINVTSSSNLEIKNLEIRNLYVHTTPSDPASFSVRPTAIYFNANGNNISIHNCKFHGMPNVIGPLSGSGQHDLDVYSNIFYDYDHGVTVTGATTPGYSSVRIHDNDFGSTAVWDNTTNAVCTASGVPWECCTGAATGNCACTTTSNYHHDGIHLFLINPYSSSILSDIDIYNNYFHGDWGHTPTAMIFTEDRTNADDEVGGIWRLRVFNNISAPDALTYTGNSLWMTNGHLQTGHKQGLLANNTIIGAGASDTAAIGVRTFSGSVVKNNIVTTSKTLATTIGTTDTTHINRNLYADAKYASPFAWGPGSNVSCVASGNPYWCCTGLGTGTCISGNLNTSCNAYHDPYTCCWDLDTGSCQPSFATTNTGTFATYQGWLGADTNSQYVADAKLNSDGTLKVDSVAIGTGENLTSLGIAALNYDKLGNARPSSGAWDIGAIQSGSAPPVVTKTVTPSSSGGGGIFPSTAQVITQGDICHFTIETLIGWQIAMGGTCPGSLTGTDYAAGPITDDCTVTATYSVIPKSIKSGIAVSGGVLWP